MSSLSLYEKKIQELGLTLPEPAKPAGIYQPVVFSGILAHLSGQLPRGTNGTLLTGKVGKDVSLQAAQEAARVAALNVVSVIRNLIGFDRFEKFVKVTGYVHADPSFYDLSAVMNGASELFGTVFGAEGVHARTSVGVASLPLNAVIEIDAVIQVKPLDANRKLSS